ncbi:hypothetical protein SAMN05444143_102195 [Flavobacterium succinicans]|uniref:HNH endonuclease n=1 Tax=Flavobacterium succinicans TaxID=29536 RepID=A0A1I4TMY5_9FLAO|nr:hypothetical protein [Flavobacterium succinicans]SFM78118.1 hypothetical protein SAMN05444143_102195 [Flavobacterium succinicans]
MLRTYKFIQDPIFELHKMLQHLVCEVWCNASDENTCQQLINSEFEVIYLEYDWLKEDVDKIYEECKPLLDDERGDIREAFYVNNRIEELCDGLEAIELGTLPKVVENSMLPLLRKFYSRLLDLAKVPGNKLEYYNRLVNDKYIYCPCCGIVKIEPEESAFREDNDHFFPISKYPFAAINFNNLFPVCEKCNKKRKGTKTPQEHNGLAYYGFAKRDDIKVSVKINDSDDLDYLKLNTKDISFSFTEDANKNSTWNYLFGIIERYNKEVRDFSFTELRAIKNRIYLNKDINNGNPYDAILDFEIENYEADKYKESKFLKAAFLKEIKNRPEWMAVYNKD